LAILRAVVEDDDGVVLHTELQDLGFIT
jgi:hypothetical protein